MLLEAVSAGYAVPRRDFTAEVHSAFNSAANLRLLEGGRLITLVAFQEPDLPQGIRLRTPEPFSFGFLTRGERVACRDGILSCAASPLEVDLRRAARWRCDLAALAIDLNHPATRLAWQTATREVEDCAPPGGFPPAQREMERVTPQLLAAVARLDGPAALQHAAGLIGLGPGLTPAGDDYLVGFLAGLWSAATDAAYLHFVSGLGKGIIRLTCRTNDISRAYLLHAARGQVSSRLNDLAAAIAKGENPQRLRQVAQAALQVGHLSGLAATQGLLAGLAVWWASRSLHALRINAFNVEQGDTQVAHYTEEITSS